MGKRNYVGFAKMGNVFGPAIGDGEYYRNLPAGHYKVDYEDYRDKLIITRFEPRLDEILNLNSKEFNDAVEIAQTFLSKNSESEYVKSGFLYKRSFLFYGPPGTGKSVLSSKISDLAVGSRNAIAIYPKSLEALQRILEVLDETDSDRFKVIVLEEFDDIVNRRGYEAEWTTVLDGQFQSSNRLIVATTNNIDAIPRRLLRPGRFSSIVHIPALSAESRKLFLQTKNVPAPMISELVDQTEGFTVDDLKEVVQGYIILGDKSTVSAIRRAKELGQSDDE